MKTARTQLKLEKLFDIFEFVTLTRHEKRNFKISIIRFVTINK